MTLRRQSTYRARKLRRTSTPAEHVLWSLLRGRRLAGAKFRRQQPLGPFIVDFYCAAADLAVEAEGSSHASRAQHDAARDAFLNACGIRVLRFANHEILQQPQRVVERIRQALRVSNIAPLPPGEGLG
jgi:very-short-patch-repair endonuclease